MNERSQQHTAGRYSLACPARRSDSAPTVVVVRRLHSAVVATVLAAANFTACQPHARSQPPGAGNSAPAVEKQYYLSLGNSLAAHEDGYTYQLYAMARPQIPELEHVNLACGGESTRGMIHGGWCDPDRYAYPHGTQLAEAVSFLKAHSEDMAFVTIDIGANDLTACAQPPGTGEPLDLDRARAYFALPESRECVDLILQNVGRIATELRSAAGPDTRIVGMNYYSGALAAWLTGPEGRLVATQLTDSVLVPFNTALEATFAAADIPTADVAAAFSTTDYTLVIDPRLGEVPLNVLRICQWTQMCSRGDHHPNTEGGRVITQAFATVLGL